MSVLTCVPASARAMLKGRRPGFMSPADDPLVFTWIWRTWSAPCHSVTNWMLFMLVLVLDTPSNQECGS